MGSTYTGKIVTPVDVAMWESLHFRDANYLTFDGASGTQSGTFGVTLLAPGVWKITEVGAMYHIDTAGGDITVIIPDVTSSMTSQTISMVKPSLSLNTNTVSVSTVGGQSIGPKIVYSFSGPGDSLSLVATKYGTNGAINYRWRQAWNNISDNGVLKVNKSNKFNSIKQAVLSIGNEATAEAPYEIQVAPGTYYEDTITLPAHVNIIGDSHHTVNIVSLSGEDLFVLNHDTSIHNVTLSGAKNVDSACVRFSEHDGVGIGLAELDSCDLRDNYYGILIENPSQVNHMYVSHCFADGKNVYPVRYNNETGAGWIVGSFDGWAMAIAGGEHVKNAFWVNGTKAQLEIYNSHVRVQGGTCDVGVLYYDDASVRMHDVFIENVTVGISGADIGDPSKIECNSLTMEGCASSMVVDHEGNYGFMQGFFPSENLITSDGITTTFMVPGTAREVYTGGVMYQRDFHQSEWLPITTLLRETTNLGLVSGGDISKIESGNGLSATVAAGYGYIHDNTNDVVFRSWPDTVVEVETYKTQVIAYNPDTEQMLVLDTQPINNTNIIVLGSVVALDEIDHIIDAPITMTRQGNKIETMLRRGFGPVYESAGSLVTVNSALQISVGAGRYYYGTTEFALNGGTNIEFESYWLGPSSTWTESELSAINNLEYSASGALIPMTSGYYAKHELFTVGKGEDEQYLMLQAQAEHSTFEEALTAALPTKPSFYNNAIVPIASIITKQDDTSSYVTDLRPRFGASSTVSVGGGGGVTVHNDLQGRDEPDAHSQYLLRSGGDGGMEASLDMAANDIINAGTINGVTIEDHSADHAPNSIKDPLPVAIAVTLGQENGTGGANSFSRSDHVHAHGVQSASDNHALATDSTHGFMASSDKSGFTIMQVTSSSWDEAHVESGILLGTGLINGGALSVNPLDNTTFDVASGTGYYVDNTTNAGTSFHTVVSWPATTGIPADYIGSVVRSHIMITSAGEIFQLNRQPSVSEARDYIILGRLLHDDMATLNGAVTIPRVVYNTALDSDDVSISIGTFTIDGNTVTPNGSNLALDIASGHSFRTGANYTYDPKNPNTTEDDAKTPITFRYRYRGVGVGTFTYGSPTTAINPNVVDIGTGTLSAVPAGQWTVQRVYMFPNRSHMSNYYVVPGQYVYDSLTTAKTNISYENPVLDPLLSEASLRAYLFIKQNATALNNSSQAALLKAGRFGEIGGGASAGGDVIGPDSADDNALVAFNGTGGKIIKDSGYTTSNADGWESGYTTVLSNSANWNYQGTDLKELSAGWVGGNSAYTLVNGASANWNDVFTTVQLNSATTWNYQGTDLKGLSAGWVGGNSAYTTVNANSATTWNYQGTDLKDLSAGWVGGNSAYTLVNGASANWNSGYGQLNSLSAGWVSTQTTVNQNSATTWNYQGTDLKVLSAGWVGGNSAYTTVNTNSASWGGTQSNYAFAYDTTNQPVTAINAWQPVTFSTNGVLNGWAHTAGTSNFTCNQTGLYKIEIVGTVVRASNTTTSFELRGLFNGTEIPGSYCTASTSNTGAVRPLVSSFLLNATSGQDLFLQFAGTATANTPQLVSSTSGAGATTRPSITIAIIRIA